MSSTSQHVLWQPNKLDMTEQSEILYTVKSDYVGTHKTHTHTNLSIMKMQEKKKHKTTKHLPPKIRGIGDLQKATKPL